VLRAVGVLAAVAVLRAVGVLAAVAVLRAVCALAAVVVDELLWLPATPAITNRATTPPPMPSAILPDFLKTVPPWFLLPVD
jgi:hypothetical protein